MFNYWYLDLLACLFFMFATIFTGDILGLVFVVGFYTTSLREFNKSFLKNDGFINEN